MSEENKSEKAKPVRFERVKQFVRANSYVYDTAVSMDLLASAELLMEAASTRPRHVPAAILTTVAAFEAWINDLIVDRQDRNDQGVQHLLESSTKRKVRYLIDALKTKCSRREELHVALKVRDEFAHHYPRPGAAPCNLPAWHRTLTAKRLLASTGTEHEYTFSQQLISYRLAFWVCEVVASSAQEIVVGSDAAGTSCYENFLGLVARIPKPT